jgi:hypothetical protein
LHSRSAAFRFQNFKEQKILKFVGIIGIIGIFGTGPQPVVAAGANLTIYHYCQLSSLRAEASVFAALAEARIPRSAFCFCSAGFHSQFSIVYIFPRSLRQ